MRSLLRLRNPRSVRSLANDCQRSTRCGFPRRGVHLLLQIWTRVYDDTLMAGTSPLVLDPAVLALFLLPLPHLRLWLSNPLLPVLVSAHRWRLCWRLPAPGTSLFHLVDGTSRKRQCLSWTRGIPQHSTVCASRSLCCPFHC
jgi:hypothetical protein